MENQEEHNNQNEVLEDENVDSLEEIEKRKKARILIVIEIILLLLVVILAIIFFSSRRGGINIFNRSNNIQNQGPSSGDLQINEDIVGSPEGDSSLVTDEASVYIPERSESEIVESPRMYLPVPDQSPVRSEEDIPDGAIKIAGLDSGFSPSEFTVNKGEEITLSLTSRIKYPVVLTFYEETMPAISIGCGPYETRWITFTVPSDPGEYIFRNDVFGKTEQIGKMIVQ
jgi:hypothetical protein